ncbi:MAG: histidine phosphatase family protein [Lachnospiraceae bacterium]|nr:histidine phosphatase family protein [Lachnospiraceae bacterium]
MEIWLTRHGQTRYNKEKRMQGLTDEPLNEVGRAQAAMQRSRIGDIRFDAVYASPLDRAVETGAIIGGCSREQIRVDERLIEVDFGCYELKKYTGLGLRMSAYWALPELFPAPATVETTEHMIRRSQAFLQELEQQPFERVLVAAHGGIMRALSGYLMDRRNGLMWRPKMHNCEIRVFESEGGVHRFVRSYPSVKEKEC